MPDVTKGVTPRRELLKGRRHRLGPPDRLRRTDPRLVQVEHGPRLREVGALGLQGPRPSIMLSPVGGVAGEREEPPW